MEAVGLDEFGREHFVVEAAPGRLCMTLSETEQGCVVVCRLDNLTQDDLTAWDEMDRKRMQLLRQMVSIGDRLIAIEGEDAVHRAVVDGFLPLPDGSASKLARDPRIHRGCQIVNVNGVDVSCSRREKVIEILSGVRDQEKEIIIYRAAPETCAKFVQAEYTSAEIPQGFAFDESGAFKCVVATTTILPMKATLLQGDVLIGVNDADVSCLNRRDALALLTSAPFPRTLYFYRSRPVDLPECHQIRIESVPSDSTWMPLDQTVQSSQASRVLLTQIGQSSRAAHRFFLEVTSS